MFESVHIGAPPPRCCIFLSSSRTLWLTTGPHCCPAPPVSRVVPRPAALPSLLACLRHERALPHPTAPPRAIPAPRSGCRPHTPLFLSFFLCSVACPSRSPPPPFPSVVLPRATADLGKPLDTHSVLFHVHTRARAPLLLHRLCARLTSSRHWRTLLLSGSCLSTTAACHYR
jgi:hypothetical protein